MRRLSILLGAVVMSSQAIAQWAAPSESKGVEFSFGLGAARAPVYLGSDESETRALPFARAVWSNGWFAGFDGVGYTFPSTSPLRYGLRLSIDPGRDEKDALALAGMGDIETRPEMGAFVSYSLLPGLQGVGHLRLGSGNDRDGALAEMGIRAMRPLGSRQQLLAGISVTWANQAAMQSRYGVDAVQSAASGYRIYSPGAGLQDVELSLGWGYALTPAARVRFSLAASGLLGDARDSPIVRRSRNNSAMLLLEYRP